MNKQEAMRVIRKYLPSALAAEVIEAFSNPEWEKVLREKLEDQGTEVRIAHFSGDNSYPTEYTLTCGIVKSNAQPTLDLALVDLVGRLRPRSLPCDLCGGEHYHGQRCPNGPK